jgi:hypothetical protein
LTRVNKHLHIGILPIKRNSHSKSKSYSLAEGEQRNISKHREMLKYNENNCERHLLTEIQESPLHHLNLSKDYFGLNQMIHSERKEAENSYDQSERICSTTRGLEIEDIILQSPYFLNKQKANIK